MLIFTEKVWFIYLKINCFEPYNSFGEIWIILAIIYLTKGKLIQVYIISFKLKKKYINTYIK